MRQTALKRLQVAQRHTTLSGHNQRPYSYQRPPPGSPRAPPTPGPPPPQYAGDVRRGPIVAGDGDSFSLSTIIACVLCEVIQ